MTPFEKLIQQLQSPRNIKNPQALLDKLDELVRKEAALCLRADIPRQVSLLNDGGWYGQVEFLAQRLSIENIGKELEPFLRPSEESDEYDDKPAV